MMSGEVECMERRIDDHQGNMDFQRFRPRKFQTQNYGMSDRALCRLFSKWLFQVTPRLVAK
jgi:hypothetical protein